MVILYVLYNVTGIIYAITALGVGAGYIGGGQLLTLYVDFNTVDE